MKPTKPVSHARYWVEPQNETWFQPSQQLHHPCLQRFDTFQWLQKAWTQQDNSELASFGWSRHSPYYPREPEPAAARNPINRLRPSSIMDISMALLEEPLEITIILTYLTYESVRWVNLQSTSARWETRQRRASRILHNSNRLFFNRPTATENTMPRPPWSGSTLPGESLWVHDLTWGDPNIWPCVINPS